jgi:hypothetical protein
MLFGNKQIGNFYVKIFTPYFFQCVCLCKDKPAKFLDIIISVAHRAASFDEAPAPGIKNDAALALIPFFFYGLFRCHNQIFFYFDAALARKLMRILAAPHGYVNNILVYFPLEM